jgi:site-specific recombinase XerD
MMLFESTRSYVERKRNAGLTYVKSASILSAFCRQVGDVPLGCITQRQVAAFLAGPQTSTVTWRQKYSLLKNLFEFWAARGGLQALPMPPIRPPCPRTFVPYVYSRAELGLLLRATRFSQKRAACMIEARTLRALLLFLYGTGAQTGEALKLMREKVDLRNSLVTIPGGRFNRVRCIPIGPDLHEIMRRYLQSTARKKTQSLNFFVTRDGMALNVNTLSKSFQRLRRIAGIARHEGGRYQPRMHDLRHTFAVHRLTAWFMQRADLNRMLPALAAYMGQVGLGSTEKYLSMTPERFRKQLVKLSPQRRKRRWRDNPTLIKFLAEL